MNVLPRRKNERRLWWYTFSDAVRNWCILQAINYAVQNHLETQEENIRKSISPKVHDTYRTARTALSRAALTPNETPRPCSLEKNELVGCGASLQALVTISKKTLHAARLSTVHVTQTLLYCKDKEEFSNSIASDRDTHQSMPSGGKYSASSMKQKIYAKCNFLFSLLRVLRMADSRKVHTPELAICQGENASGS